MKYMGLRIRSACQSNNSKYAQSCRSRNSRVHRGCADSAHGSKSASGAIDMEPFIILTGPAAPLMRANIDTDIIIRIERITQLSKQQLAQFGMEALRFLADGSEDPAFALVCHGV